MRKEMSYKYFIQKTFIILCVFILVFYFMPVTVLALAIQEKIDLNEILNEEATKATEKVEMLLEEEKQIAGEKENYKTKAILREEVEKRKVNEKQLNIT